MGFEGGTELGYREARKAYSTFWVTQFCATP